MTIKIHAPAMLAAIGLALGTALTVPATAQEDTQQAEQGTQAQAFDDSKLQSFAVAFLAVDKIRREYAPKVKQATSKDEQKQIQTEAGQKMVGAVQDAEGISVDEYNEIIQSAQADPDLAQRLNDIIQKKAAQ